jgi:nitrate reductase gamma subunit
MNTILISELLAAAGFAIGVAGLYVRYARLSKRALPTDFSPMKGSPTRAVHYALTQGMLPWEKESTRTHGVAYVRGIIFHVGIFSALAVLLAEPWWASLPAWLRLGAAGLLALGALLGAAGGVARGTERNLRSLSTPDDHFAVWFISIWVAGGALALYLPAFAVAFNLLSALALAYVPLGKVRHCLYFFFSRIFFGRFFGRRAVLPHSAQINWRVS